MEGLLTFLGSGTSMGVPSVGCECKVCTSTDPHDKRLRPSVLVQWTEPATGVRRSIVIDTGPDFREQALRAGLKRVDAVFYTHGHADHILGMDDLRPLSFTAAREVGPIPLYAAPESSSSRSPSTISCMAWISYAFRSDTVNSRSTDSALAAPPTSQM